MTVAEQQGLEALMQDWIQGDRGHVVRSLHGLRRGLCMRFVALLYVKVSHIDAEQLLDRMDP